MTKINLKGIASKMTEQQMKKVVGGYGGCSQTTPCSGTCDYPKKPGGGTCMYSDWPTAGCYCG